MKHLLFIIFLAVVLPVSAFGADSLTVSRDVMSKNLGLREIDLTLVVDGAAFSEALSSEVMTSLNEGWVLYRVRTDPGSTAPTANYDIDLTGDGGADVMGSTLDNRSATATQYARPFDVAYGSVSPTTSITVDITGNGVANADVVITLYFKRA